MQNFISISDRYQVGRIYKPNIYNSKDSLVGSIPACYGTTIGKWNITEFLSDHKIEKGYKMRISLLVRDMQTDLLIGTNETTYIFK